MSCEMTHSQLPLYFDGELDRAASREFERHLDTCQACQQALGELDVLRTRLRGEAVRFEAPRSLRAKIEHELSVSTRRPPARTGRAWMAMAASWLVALFIGGGMSSLWYHRQSQAQAGNQFAHDLFTSHWRALAASSPVDVVSTDRHTVKPWFEGRTSEAPVVKDFAAQGFPLVGGRIDYVGGERVPTLVYRHGGHLIDVFVFARSLPQALPRAAHAQGYDIRTARIDDEYVAVVTDMDDAELQKFMRLLAGQR